MTSSPVIIYDKSVIQSFNADEALWLMMYYLTNITPIFYIEVLADLDKKPAKGKNPEKIVATIGEKVASFHAYPNQFHIDVCTGNLLGHNIPMDGRPIISSGQQVVLKDGRRGVKYKNSEEMEAFQRWKEGDFYDLERQYASKWRNSLRSLELEEMYQVFHKLSVKKVRYKTFSEAKEAADRIVNIGYDDGKILYTLLNSIGVHSRYHVKIFNRWLQSGRPCLKAFAPYASYVFTINLFFNYCIISDLIARTRPSNIMDIAYLYYLPFCMVFASGDKLHYKIASLFMRNDQTFIKATDLKKDLSEIDKYYSSFPDHMKQNGVFTFASNPPTDNEFLTTKLYDKYFPRWRENIMNLTDPTKLAKIIREENKEMSTKAARELGNSIGSIDINEADVVTFEYAVPKRIGKWETLKKD